MSWKKRLKELPLVVVAAKIAPILPNQCIEDIHHGTKFIVGHEYIPGIGPAYHFSISGKKVCRTALIQELVIELGKPTAIDETNQEIWHYCWKSPSDEIPKTDARKTLGEERINQICKQFKLDDQEHRLLDEALAAFRFFTGMTTERVSFMAKLTGNMQADRREALILALFQIMKEFAAKALSQNRP